MSTPRSLCYAVMFMMGIVLWFPIAAWTQAQSNELQSTLLVTVVDEESLAIPGATVTLSGLGVSQTRISDAEGELRFLRLDPGTYQVESAIEGFNTVIHEAIEVRSDSDTRIEARLSMAETTIICFTCGITRERGISTSIYIGQAELQALPSFGDAWAIAAQAPGVLIDSVHTGSREPSRQPAIIGAGSNGTQSQFMVDGIDVTDRSDQGVSSTYLGFEQFEEMSFTTGGSDVEAQTPGVRIDLITKTGSNEWRGSGSYHHIKDSYQASNNVSSGALASTQAQSDSPLTGNRIDDMTQYGVELGGFLWKDHLWLWGSYEEFDLRQSVFGGGADSVFLRNEAYKLNATFTDANSFVYSRNQGNREQDGRGAGPQRPSETTWNQRARSPLTRVEDTHVVNSNLFLTASWAEMLSDTTLDPKGGRDTQLWFDQAGVAQGSYYFLDISRPMERWQADGSAFFISGSVSHELKFGYAHQHVEESSLWAAPGNGLVTRGSSGPDSYVTAIAWRDSSTAVSTKTNSLWIQDTLTTDRLTINLGLRYDQQEGANQASAASASRFAPHLLPALNFEGNDPDFKLSSLLPRLGILYALDEDRKSLLRASYSQFADPLASALVAELNPLGNAYASFVGFDANGDGRLQATEQNQFQAANSFDPDQIGATDSPNQIDPSIDAVITDELVLGIDHAFQTDFTGALTVTWRHTGDYYDSSPLYRDEEGRLQRIQASDYVLDGTVFGTLPDGTAFSTPIYVVHGDLTNTGGVYWTQTDRSTEYLGYTLSATKRLANRWMLRAHATFYDWTWSIGPEFRRFDDPTDRFNDHSGSHAWNTDNDGAPFAEQSDGSGTANQFLNSRWSFNISGMVELPRGFNVSGNINGREGYPQPWFGEQISTSDGTKDVQFAAVDRDRADNLITADLRVDKDFQIRDLDVTLSVDLFNLLNEGYAAQRDLNTGGMYLSEIEGADGASQTVLLDKTNPRAGYVQQTISPRAARLGVRIAWK